MRVFSLSLLLFLSVKAFSQEKCVGLFSTQTSVNQNIGEAAIQTKLEALVLLQFQIEQNIFEKDSQLTQAKENLAKQLQELIKIDKKYLAEFRRLKAERQKNLKNQNYAENEIITKERNLKEDQINKYKVFSPEEILELLPSHKLTEINTTIFSADSKLIAYSDKAGLFKVVDIASGKEILSRMQLADAVTAVAFSPDGKSVVVAMNSAIKSFDLKSGRESLLFQNKLAVNSVRISNDGKYLIISSHDNTAKVIEMSSGIRIASAKFANAVRFASISSDGKYLMANNTNQTKIVDINAGKEHLSYTYLASRFESEFSNDGKYFLTPANDYSIKVIETSSGKVIATIQHSNVTNSARFSSDGKYVISTSDDNMVKILDVANNHEVTSLTNLKFLETVSLSPTNKFILASGFTNITQLFDFEAQLVEFEVKNAGNKSNFSPDGEYFVTSTRAEKGIKIFKLYHLLTENKDK